MSKVINLKRGLDIRLKGEADKVIETIATIKKVAVKPTDFFSLSPKIVVKPGQQVKAGDPIFLIKTIRRSRLQHHRAARFWKLSGEKDERYWRSLFRLTVKTNQPNL